ncbi:MAG: NAD(P)/FAD-dependent oxidoreductase [Desulfonatronovibrionaceae bacterium]
MIDLAVVGAGPAGMIAAGTAGMRGLEVVVLEKNNRPGKKLLITGKGRCNITNQRPAAEMITCIPGNGKFLINALYRFDSSRLIEFFESRKVPLKVERGGRVFPASDSSRDVLACLQEYMSAAGVKMVHRRVRGIERREYGFRLCLGGDRTLDAANVLLATGGKSYQATGSTGDGYPLAESLGHAVILPRPALVPLEADLQGLSGLQGLSLRNVGFEVLDRNGRVVFKDIGELLFTHFGLSGPMPLSASLHMDPERNYTLVVDLKPGLGMDKLIKRIQRDFRRDGRKKIKNAMSGLTLDRMIPVVLEQSRVDGEKQAAQADKEEMRRLSGALKGVGMEFTGLRRFDEAIVTAGGVDVSGVDPRTMQSKTVPGLYFAGEILDVYGYTGGYNLHIAFATGYAAGSACTGHKD